MGARQEWLKHKEVIHCPGRRIRSTYTRRVIPLEGLSETSNHAT